MNAEELCRKDKGPTGVWFCTKCGTVGPTQELADQCCVPKLCACGAPLPKYRLRCNTCETVAMERAQQLQFERAEKVSEETWDGPVCCDGEDKYFENVGEARDYYEDIDEPLPDFFWTAEKVSFVKFNLYDLADRFESEAYEDFEMDDLSGVEEFEAAIAKFIEANKDVVSYRANLKKAVILLK